MIHNSISIFLCSIIMICSMQLKAQGPSDHGNKFEQLGTILPTPNSYRNMDGSPGPDYWQQRVDYDIECSLDEKLQQLRGN